MTRTSNPVYVTKDTARKIVDKYDNFLFDCDGVVWLDEDLIPGASSLLEYLTAHRKKHVAFVTNNSSKSRCEYLAKFQRLAIENVTLDMIYPTCYSAALEIRDVLHIPPKSKIWVLGDHGIEQELANLGYVVMGGTDTQLDDEFDAKSALLRVDPDVRAVVVGSTKSLNYMRIAATLQYLLYKNKSIPFIGTNIDKTYPGADGLVLPAGGSVVSFMADTAQRDFISVGKPSRRFLDLILRDRGFDRDRTLMVGDTLYTDVKFANDGDLGGGQGSLLVLSGGTTRDDLEAVVGLERDESLTPSYYTESLGHLMDLLRD
ncbi:uncharacterized protein LODBEIA_P49200 [Lodderomyces beijingensis]|uniref:4-nitrophenylphosphatase n=1 Tax=Lodderomyces beijingensis TaxID=1775926 RepID=A0ABP0ZUN6_9ASCO